MTFNCTPEGPKPMKKMTRPRPIRIFGDAELISGVISKSSLS